MSASALTSGHWPLPPEISDCLPADDPLAEDANWQPLPFEASELDRISDLFWQEGYLYLPRPLFSDAELAPVRDSIAALAASGLPPVFVYLSDRPWYLFARLSRLLAHFLGDNYAILPHLWAWHVAQGEEEAGWPPHRDCQGETVYGEKDGPLSGGDNAMLVSLSLWIPLTDVGPENGCMYVLPTSRERLYPAMVTAPSEVDLQDVRALPAPAGSVMGWRQDLYHWGARSTPRASQPRISLSFEFQNRAFAPLATPLLDGLAPPDHETRLALIRSQFAKYGHMDRRAEHWAALFGLPDASAGCL